MSIRLSRILWALAVPAALGGCQNHITGSPPRPPWYRLTNEAREGAYSRAHPPPPEAAAHAAWARTIGAANLREFECHQRAAAEPDAAIREQKHAACVAEVLATTRAADELNERNRPADYDDERPGRAPRSR